MFLCHTEVPLFLSLPLSRKPQTYPQVRIKKISDPIPSLSKTFPSLTLERTFSLTQKHGERAGQLARWGWDRGAF